LLSLVTIVLAAVMPGLGSVIGEKQFERATALRAEMTAASWLLLAAIGSTILIWNRSFIHLWVGDQHYAGTLTNLLMVLMIVQLIFIRNDAYVIDLTLELREKVVMGAVAAILSISLSAILIPRLGIAGLCLGMILGRLSLSLSYPIVINKRFGRKRLPSLMPAVRPALTMAGMFAGSAYLSQVLLVNNWLLWATAAGLTFTLALGIAALVGLSSDVRRPLHKRLSMLRTVFESR
jgi:O-antigen/teichoic acid export membrane protein